MTDKFLWNNKAITTLYGAHNNTTTTINLNPGDGALFPSPSSGEHFAVTIQASDGTAEVCYCTSRSVDALTVTRGQEASLGAPVAQTYVGGEAVELRVTAGTLNEFSQITVAETIPGNKTHTGKVVIIDGVADQEPPSILQSKLLGVMSATGAGTVDAITATFAPVFAALTNGLTCIVRASGANTSTTPTFKPDSLTAKIIVARGNTALNVGDIKGAGHELILRYNSTNDNWELLNPSYEVIKTYFASNTSDITVTAGTDIELFTLGSIVIPTRGLIKLAFTGKFIDTGNAGTNQVAIGIKIGSTYYFAEIDTNGGGFIATYQFQVGALQYTTYRGLGTGSLSDGNQAILDIEATSIPTGVQTVSAAIRSVDGGTVRGADVETRFYLKAENYA